jgi:hypothetical protein
MLVDYFNDCTRAGSGIAVHTKIIRESSLVLYVIDLTSMLFFLRLHLQKYKIVC